MVRLKTTYILESTDNTSDLLFHFSRENGFYHIVIVSSEFITHLSRIYKV